MKLVPVYTALLPFIRKYLISLSEMGQIPNQTMFKYVHFLYLNDRVVFLASVSFLDLAQGSVPYCLLLRILKNLGNTKRNRSYQTQMKNCQHSERLEAGCSSCLGQDWHISSHANLANFIAAVFTSSYFKNRQRKFSAKLE